MFLCHATRGVNVRVYYVSGVKVDKRNLFLLRNLQFLVQELEDVELGLKELDSFPAKVVSGTRKEELSNQDF